MLRIIASNDVRKLHAYLDDVALGDAAMEGISILHASILTF